MPILKNNRHEKFALALFKGMSQKDAAIEAGYKESRAYETSYRLVRNGQILDRILQLQKQSESDAVMSVTERKERLSEIARARLIDFVEAGPEGSHISVGLESTHSAALQEVTSRTEGEDDEKTPAIITKIRLHNPIPAIAELNKMEKIYEAEGGMTINQQIVNINVLSERARELTQRVLEGERTGGHDIDQNLRREP